MALSAGKRRILQVAVTLLVLGALVYSVDLQQARELLRRADAFTLVAMMLLFPLDRLFMAWKWLLLARVHDRRISFWTGTRVYLGSSAGMFLPVGGLGPDLVRVALLSKHGMASEHAVASILVERLCGIAGALLMLMTAGVLLIMLLPGSLGAIGEHLQAASMWVGIAAVVVVATGAVMVRRGWLRRTMSSLGRRPRLQKFASAIHDYSGHQRLLGLSVVLAWLEQLAPVVAFWLAARGFDVPIGLLESAAIVPLASALERLPISFAGIGIKEAGIVLAAGWFGISHTDAFLVALFEHTAFIVTMIPLALLYFAGRSPTSTPEPQSSRVPP